MTLVLVDTRRNAWLVQATHTRMGLRLSELAEVAIEGGGQASFLAGLAEHPVGAFTELAGGRSREGGVQGVELGQQANIGGGIAEGKRFGRRAAAVNDAATLAELVDKAGNLGSRDPGDVPQIAVRLPFVWLGKPSIGDAAQFRGDQRVAGRPGAAKPRGWMASEEGADLLQPLESMGLQAHEHHPR
ncbi:MAG: hypothetical protein B7Z66_14815 [Chromatiales bacterium 21-64-14]|nr:MAG: hypothetical protein B7Z66_14815 [Chromatiales bacterium 21-64-14]